MSDITKNNRPTPRKREVGVRNTDGVTRRQFLIGAGVAGGILAIGGGTYFTLSSGDAEVGSEKLSVSVDQVFTIEDLELVDDVSEFLHIEREIKLNYNTLVRQESNEVLAILERTEVGMPVCTASTLQISNGDKTTVLEAATTTKPRFEVLDFHANESGFAWIESNVLTGENVVMSTMSDTSNASVLMSCDSAQKMPHVAMSDTTIWVQTAPQESTSGEREKLFIGKIGAQESQLELMSDTRGFAAAPIWTHAGIVTTPRNSYSASSYDVRLVNGKTGEVLDNLTLPQSMKPQDVTYGTTGFSFSFQGSYSYGNGIASVGTYVQGARGIALGEDSDFAKDQRNMQLSEQFWLSFNREPTCPCAWIGNYVCVKSTSSVAVIDLANKRYALIKADDGADDYGVWLVSTGEVEHLVTLQNINYTTLSGSLLKEGRLKIWGV